MLYEVQLWGCVSALLVLPAELIPHNFPEVETSGKEILKQETFYEVQSWGCVSALLGLPAELIPHNFPEVETSGKEMLKQETFYEVQSWGCVSALPGLPAELIPHMFSFVSCDVSYYTSNGEICQLLFSSFFIFCVSGRSGTPALRGCAGCLHGAYR